MSEAQIGWGAGVNLDGVDLEEVVSFPLPDEQVEEVEVTHLKSPQKRREFIAGMIDAGEVEVALNYIPNSATDVKIRELKTSGEVVTVVFTIPDDTATWEITTSCFVKGYGRGPVAASEKMSCTVRLRITGAQTEVAGV